MFKRKNFRKIFLILVCSLSFCLFAYIGFKQKVSARGESMICLQEKMVPIGSLNDQTIFSVNRILTQIQNVLNYSGAASQNATDLINTVKNGCKPENCGSECKWETEQDPCPGTGVCPNGNECDFLDPLSVCEREVCREKECSGNNPCPFGSISGSVAAITANRIGIEAAAQEIDDFFNLDIDKFPEPSGDASIFGKFCNNLFLSKQFCTTCFVSCATSEFNALTFLESKAIDTIQKCDIIKPEELFVGKQGEMLYTCKEVMPEPVERCYPNDFFCCSAEEPK